MKQLAHLHLFITIPHNYAHLSKLINDEYFNCFKAIKTPIYTLAIKIPEHYNESSSSNTF